MASTYPLEVVQADRWFAANKKLKVSIALKLEDGHPTDGLGAFVAAPGEYQCAPRPVITRAIIQSSICEALPACCRPMTMPAATAGPSTPPVR
ncbi:DUF3300 domain-containing protein [Bosea sp. NBC_00550]|uniref:DUF3300 domain-containing protein n=1 Tax=Bosea sp. NBC_00550 TaxID=2969621 RepID=UPI003FA45910